MTAGVVSKTDKSIPCKLHCKVIGESIDLAGLSERFSLSNTDDNVYSAFFKVQGMCVALRTVPDNRYCFSSQYVLFDITVIIYFYHFNLSLVMFYTIDIVLLDDAFCWVPLAKAVVPVLAISLMP